METEQKQLPFTIAFWLAGFILAWAIDLLFWNQTPGLTFLIWTTLCVAWLFAAAWWEHRRPALASYLLGAITLGLGATPMLRSEPFSAGFTAFLTLCALGLLAGTFTTGYWLLYRIGDTLLAWMKIIVAGIIRAGQSLARKPSPESEQIGQVASHALKRNGFPILRGLFLSLPVVAVLAGLLASADPVFARVLENVLRIFDIENLPEYIFRFTYVMIFTYVFTGVLLHAVIPEPVEPRPDPQEPWKMRFLGSTESSIVFGSVVILFAVFVALQFRYLFGGQSLITETGFTYSEYARRGFFELVWVAVLSLGLYIVLGAVTRRESPGQERAFTLLSITLMGLVLVILVSALNRLVLYENAYGFTRLRTYTHIFIPWLAALLLTAIVLQAVRRQGHLGLALVLIVFGFGLTFTAINVDDLIVRLNLQRTQAGLELDAAHLVGLSADSVPAVARAYQDSTYSTADREKLGAVLACHKLYASQQTDWRSFRISESRAQRILAGIDLSRYTSQTENYNEITLNGEPFYCYYSMYD